MARPSILAQKSEINDLALATTAVINLEAFARTGETSHRDTFLQLVNENKEHPKFVEALVQGVRGNKLLGTLIDSYFATKNEHPGPVELAAAIEDTNKVLRGQTLQRARPNLVKDYGEGFVKAIEPFVPAELAAKPAVAQKPPAEKPSVESQAQATVTALEAFIRTGNDQYRQQIQKTMQDNKDSKGEFSAEFSEEVNRAAKENNTVWKIVEAAKGSMRMDELLEGIAACQAMLRKQPGSKSKDELIGEYGAKFVQAVEIFTVAKIAPAMLMTRGTAIEDATITSFIDLLRVDVGKLEPRERRLEAITLAVRDRFKIKDLVAADVVAKALMYGYELLGKSDRKLFPQWLSEASTLSAESFVTQLMQVATSQNTTLSYEYVRQSFQTWKVAKETEAAELAELRSKVNAFKPHVKETGSDVLMSRIEKDATGMALGDLAERYQYLTLSRQLIEKTKPKDAEKKIAAIDKEIDKLYAWLSTLGLVKGGNVSPEAVGRAIKMIQDEFVLIETSYMYVAAERRPLMPPRNLEPVPELIAHMKAISANDAFFTIFKKHLSAVDAASARMFTDVKPDSPRYIELVSQSISSFMNQSDVKTGAAAWYTDYYAPSPPSRDDIVRGSPVAFAYNALEKLTPLAAAVFYRYMQVARDADVGKSQEDKKLIVDSVVKLNALNPLLIVKYFSAITNLARICENDPDVYRQALTDLAARIDTAAAPLLSPTTPAQVIPFSNVRKIVDGLDSAFGEIMKIEKSALAQFDRLDLMDERVIIRQRPPHEIVQRPPRYKPDLLVPKNRIAGFMSPYFLPPYMATIIPRFSFAGGGVYTSPQTYGGNVMLPQVRLQAIYPPVGAVEMAMENYLDPKHPMVAISSFLPGGLIKRLSPTRLMLEINKAFIPTNRPEYSLEPLAWGGGFGGGGRKVGEEWQTTLGGMGAIITPTGGAALGGMKTDVRTFIGGTMVAVPIGFIPHTGENVPVAGVIWGKRGKEERVMGTDTAVVGYDALDGGQKKILARAVQTTWTQKNPAQQLFVLNRDELPGSAWDYSAQIRSGAFSQIPSEARQKILAGLTEGDVPPAIVSALRQGKDLDPSTAPPTIDEQTRMNNALTAKKAVMTARYFYVDKEGTIFELKGGQNDMVRILNFAAGYGNQQFMTPTTYAWNYEPMVKKGGYVMAIDLDKTPILAHFQDMPLFVPETTEAPRLVQWTTAAATTVTSKGSPAVNIHTGEVFGQMLTIHQQPGTTGDKDQDFDVKDVGYRFRRVEGQDAWELSVGAGRAGTPDGSRYRGGFFLRTQHPKSTAGGGLYYEASAADLTALSVIQTQESRNYVQSLHRIGATLYGTKAGENKFVMGALAHVVPQFKMTLDAQQQNIAAAQTPEQKAEAQLKYDTTLYRFVGFLKGMDAGARADVARYTGYDRMMQDYENMATQVGNDPAGARDAMTRFGQQYAQSIDKLFNEYYLGIQVNKDFSLEASIISREKEGWASQFSEMPDSAYARALYTWDTGFARVFSSVPTLAPYGAAGGNRVGVVGAGIGGDVLDGFFMQRVAADVGMMFARAEVERVDPNQLYTTYQTWEKSGWFIQGAARVFSNFIEDAKAYRELRDKFDKYTISIGKGQFSALPAEVRSKMAENMISRDMIKGVMEGSDTRMSASDKKVLGEVLKVLREEDKMGRDPMAQQKIDAEYNGYTTGMREGKLSELPESIRMRMAQRASPNAFPPNIVRGVRDGVDVDNADPNELAAVNNVMKEGWFYEKKMAINKEFNGDLRAFMGASRYDFGDRVYYDVAAFVQMVDAFRMYLIYARREEPTVFAGADVRMGRLRVGALAGVAERGGGGAVSAAYRFGETAGLAAELAVTGAYAGPVVPNYAMPLFGQVDRTGQGEWLAFVTFTMGASERLPNVLQPMPTTTGPQTTYPGQGGYRY